MKPDNNKQQLPNLPELPDNFRIDSTKIEKSFDTVVLKNKEEKPVSKNNIYKAAWDKVYNSYPDWRKREIDGFIKSGELDNKFYTDFVQQIIATAELSGK